jgi:photosystem II stability/assembly factor-like uncharacterized protein
MKIYIITLLLVFVSFSNIYTQDCWEKTNGLDTVTIYSLAIDSSGNIFAGTDSNGVWRSTNNGDNWSFLGLMDYKIQSIVISTNEDILVGVADQFADGGIHRSSDNGNSFDTLGIPEHPVTSIAINSIGYIFAGTAAVGVYRSQDDGTNWAQINQGLDTTGLNLNTLAIDSSGDIFAGTINGGIFQSEDDGENWVQTNADSLYVLSLAINSSGDIFAGTSSSGVFRSTDNGVNWVQINQGIAGQGLYVYSLAINSNGDIFAGTDDGIFQSTDNGNNWVQINQGLTNITVRSLAINSDGDVFAGTDAGIFRTNPSANIKVFLQGPYASGSMNTTLRENGYIPLAQPYNVAPFNYNGVEEVDSIPAEVVDWVLLELRSDSATQVSRRAAFLKSDGSLVDIDGVSSVKFPTVTPGNYYVVIRHRNHLAVMTANPVTLSYSPVLFDFSTAQTQAYGTNAMKDLGGGVFGLYTGDGNRDGLVTSTDFNVFNPKFTSAASGYEYSDWNLDGLVTSTDFNFFIPNFTTAKQTFVP